MSQNPSPSQHHCSSACVDLEKLSFYLDSLASDLDAAINNICYPRDETDPPRGYYKLGVARAYLSYLLEERFKWDPPKKE